MLFFWIPALFIPLFFFPFLPHMQNFEPLFLVFSHRRVKGLIQNFKNGFFQFYLSYNGWLFFFQISPCMTPRSIGFFGVAKFPDIFWRYFSSSLIWSLTSQSFALSSPPFCQMIISFWQSCNSQDIFLPYPSSFFMSAGFFP